MFIKKLKWFGVIGILLLSFFTATVGVLADDDDDDERYERSGYQEEYHGGDDDDEEYEDEYEGEDRGYFGDGNGGYENSLSVQNGYWNFWVREAVSTQNTNLPITQAGEITVKVNGTDAGKIHVVPQEGQLLVPGEQFAKLLGAKTDFYSKSRILVVTKSKTELIVRAGSNAAYENKNKTPMPIQAQYIETSLYIPVSVIANALGYRVSWNEVEQVLSIDNI